jgi:hypothetical protein
MDYYTLVIHVVIGVLASTVKNPTSARAVRLRAIVQELHDATEEFLAATDPSNPKVGGK